MDDLSREDVDRLVSELSQMGGSMGVLSNRLQALQQSRPRPDPGPGRIRSSLQRTAQGYRNLKNKIDNIQSKIDEYNDKVESFTNAVERSVTAMEGGGTHLTQYLRTMLEKIPAVGGAGGIAFEAIMDMTDTYRRMVNIGQNFSSNMFAMQKAAADGQMTMDEFARAVERSSSTIATLSGGASAFAKFSRDVRSSIAKFGAYGNTIGNVNDFTGDYLTSYRLLEGLHNRNMNQLRYQIETSLLTTARLSTATGKAFDAITQTTGDVMKDPLILAHLRARGDSNLNDSVMRAVRGMSALDGPAGEMFARAVAEYMATENTMAHMPTMQKLVEANADRVINLLTQYADSVRAGSDETAAMRMFVEAVDDLPRQTFQNFANLMGLSEQGVASEVALALASVSGNFDPSRMASVTERDDPTLKALQAEQAINVAAAAITGSLVDVSKNVIDLALVAMEEIGSSEFANLIKEQVSGGLVHLGELLGSETVEASFDEYKETILYGISELSFGFGTAADAILSRVSITGMYDEFVRLAQALLDLQGLGYLLGGAVAGLVAIFFTDSLLRIGSMLRSMFKNPVTVMTLNIFTGDIRNERRRRFRRGFNRRMRDLRRGLRRRLERERMRRRGADTQRQQIRRALDRLREMGRQRLERLRQQRVERIEAREEARRQAAADERAREQARVQADVERWARREALRRELERLDAEEIRLRRLAQQAQNHADAEEIRRQMEANDAERMRNEAEMARIEAERGSPSPDADVDSEQEQSRGRRILNNMLRFASENLERLGFVGSVLGMIELEKTMLPYVEKLDNGEITFQEFQSIFRTEYAKAITTGALSLPIGVASAIASIFSPETSIMEGFESGLAFSERNIDTHIAAFFDTIFLQDSVDPRLLENEDYRELRRQLSVMERYLANLTSSDAGLVTAIEMGVNPTEAIRDVRQNIEELQTRMREMETQILRGVSTGSSLSDLQAERDRLEREIRQRDRNRRSLSRGMTPQERTQYNEETAQLRRILDDLERRIEVLQSQSNLPVIGATPVSTIASTNGFAIPGSRVVIPAENLTSGNHLPSSIPLDGYINGIDHGESSRLQNTATSIDNTYNKVRTSLGTTPVSQVVSTNGFSIPGSMIVIPVESLTTTGKQASLSLDDYVNDLGQDALLSPVGRLPNTATPINAPSAKVRSSFDIRTRQSFSPTPRHRPVMRRSAVGSLEQSVKDIPNIEPKTLASLDDAAHQVRRAFEDRNALIRAVMRFKTEKIKSKTRLLYSKNAVNK